MRGERILHEAIFAHFGSDILHACIILHVARRLSSRCFLSHVILVRHSFLASSSSPLFRPNPFLLIVFSLPSDEHC